MYLNSKRLMEWRMRHSTTLVIILILLSPSWAYRLQSDKAEEGGKEEEDKTQNKIGGGGDEEDVSMSMWPPRIPLWGFFPKSKSETSNSNHHHEEEEEGEGEEDNHVHPHHGISSHTLLQHTQSQPQSQHISFTPEEEEEEPWIVNLKRSSGQGVKRTRNYDVPQIECPPADDGMERFSCPTPDNLGRYRCVDDHVLCDGFVDCPGREDEDRQACMFYKTTKAHLDVLADALLRWARGRR